MLDHKSALLRRQHFLHGLFAVKEERGAQHLVALDQAIEGAFKGIEIKIAFKHKRDRLRLFAGGKSKAVRSQKPPWRRRQIVSAPRRNWRDRRISNLLEAGDA